MNANAIARLTFALTMLVSFSAQAVTYLHVVNDNKQEITIGHDDANRTALASKQTANKSLPLFIQTSPSDGGRHYNIYDSHEKCTRSHKDWWDIREDVTGPNGTILTGHHCMELRFAEVGCFVVKVEQLFLTFTKASDTECHTAD